MSPAFDAKYEYLLSHTPDNYEIPTLVTFEDAASTAAVEEIAGDVRTITEPRPAAHAALTTAETEQVADLLTAETLHSSPGANSFWRLSYHYLVMTNALGGQRVQEIDGEETLHSGRGDG